MKNQSRIRGFGGFRMEVDGEEGAAVLMVGRDDRSSRLGDVPVDDGESEAATGP